MPITSPGNDDDTGENHQPTLRKNTAEPVEQTLKQNNKEEAAVPRWIRREGNRLSPGPVRLDHGTCGPVPEPE